MNADQMINHMMTVIYTTADVEGIRVTRHFRPQEIVDSTLATCHSIIDGKRLSERETAVLIVRSGIHGEIIFGVRGTFLYRFTSS